MSRISSRLAAAKAAPRPYKDVTVCLDDELAAKREQLLDALEQAENLDAQDQRLSGPNDTHSGPIRAALDELAIAARDAMITLRFTRIPGNEWASLTMHHPVRVDVAIDRRYGYNLDGVYIAAAEYRSGDGTAYTHVVDDDGVHELDPGEVEQIIRLAPGSSAEEIRDEIWVLNEYEPAQRLDELVKGFGAARSSE